jgi:hypothetical protein
MSKDEEEAVETDEEWETDEEVLVQAELTGIIQANPLADENVKVKFIGLDTESPIAQFGNQVFFTIRTEDIPFEALYIFLLSGILWEVRRHSRNFSIF